MHLFRFEIVLGDRFLGTSGMLLLKSSVQAWLLVAA